MHEFKVLKATDIAKIFNQSVSWVSKNHKKLGGVKIGGRMFFPPQEKLYEHLFRGEEGVAVRFHDEQQEIHKGMVQNEKRGKRSRTEKARQPEQTDLNRHGLFDAG